MPRLKVASCFGQDFAIRTRYVEINRSAFMNTSVSQKKGRKVLNTPFSPWPSFTEEEISAASNVLASNRVNYWTGEEGRKFEKEFASWVGTTHAVAVTNGTVAIDLALQGLGIGPGDEVIVTPRSFIASVSCVVNAGGTPVFADVNRNSGNVEASTISAVVTSRTKAIIVVHLGGWPCDMEPILKLANDNGIFVIEDCAQAHGARYRGRSVGAWGHVGVWSFCQDKIMTTGGEGGMVTTNDQNLWSRMWSFKDHGKSWDAVYEREHSPGFRWVHDSFGTNWRMLEIQAAIGRLQLNRMPAWTAQRNANALALINAFDAFCGPDGPIRLPTLDCNGCTAGSGTKRHLCCAHAYYKFYMYLRNERLRDDWHRDRVVHEISARGVPCSYGSCSEVYLEAAFEKTGFRPARRLPVAQGLGQTSLMLLVHPTLTEPEIRKTGQVVSEVLELASA